MRNISCLIFIFFCQFALAQTGTVKAKSISINAYMLKFGFEKKNQGYFYAEDKSYTTSRKIDFKLNSTSCNNDYEHDEIVELSLIKISSNEGMLFVKLKDCNALSGVKTYFTGNLYLYLENGIVIKCYERANTISYVDGFTQSKYYLNKQDIDNLKKYDMTKLSFSIEDYSETKGHYNKRMISAEINDLITAEFMCNCEYEGIDKVKIGETTITAAALFQ